MVEEKKSIDLPNKLGVHLKKLKEIEQIEKAIVLKKRKEKTHYPSGYDGAGITKRKVSDDYVLLLQVKDRPEVIGVVLTYKERELAEVEMKIGITFMNAETKTKIVTKSEPVVGFNQIKNSLNKLFELINNNLLEDVVSEFEEHFKVELTDEFKQQRSACRTKHKDKLELRNQLQGELVSKNHDKAKLEEITDKINFLNLDLSSRTSNNIEAENVYIKAATKENIKKMRIR
jgi:hypothetical protein